MEASSKLVVSMCNVQCGCGGGRFHQAYLSTLMKVVDLEWV